MTKPTTLAWMTCAVLAVHTGAHAQNPGNGPGNGTDDRASPGRPIEITPYVLMGSASASGAGAAVRWPIGSRFGVELETEVKRAADHRGVRRAEPGLRPAGDRAR